MSGTSGIQNYLSNVFRPVYTYDPTTTLFTPRLELSNIDTYSGNTVSVFTLAVGDSNSNVYVGSNAGNAYNITKNVFNVAALGYGAASNISNDCNSIYIGWYAGSGGVNSKDVISIGANSGGNGSTNIFVGTSTGTVGTSNILLGHYINPGNVKNQIKIGYSNKIPIAADLSTNWVGLGGFQNRVFATEQIDISGSTYILGNVGINTEPGVNGTLDVNGTFNVDDGYGYLQYYTDISASRLVLSNFSGGTAELDVYGKIKATSLDVPTVNFSSLTVTGSITGGTLISQSDISGSTLNVTGAINGQSIHVYDAVTSGTVASDTATFASGVWSSRGTLTNFLNGDRQPIGMLKKGIMLISAEVDATHYDAKTVFVLDPATLTVRELTSNVSTGGLSIIYYGTSAYVLNSTASTVTCKWCVTYFPLP